MLHKEEKKPTSLFEVGWKHNWLVSNFSQTNLTLTLLYLFISGRQERKELCKNMISEVQKVIRSQVIASPVSWSLISAPAKQGIHLGVGVFVFLESKSGFFQNITQRYMKRAQF